MDEGSDFRLTLSGTLALRRRNQLFLLRERRGLLPLSLAPGESGIWDGRYAIVNKSDVEITVMPGPPPEIDADLPGAVRATLTGTTPQVFVDNGLFSSRPETVSVKARLSLYADFLPLFDLTLAQAIAARLGAEPVPPAPV